VFFFGRAQVFYKLKIEKNKRSNDAQMS